MPEHLTVEVSEHVATLTLTGTTMPPAFFSELGHAFRGFAEDRTLRAVVLRGSGKAFTYGLDLPAAFSQMGAHFAGGTAAQRLELLGLIRKLQTEVDAVAACPVPVVAAVHGWCIGGGLDLIAACDIRLATRDAKFSLRETKIAIVADLGSLQRLPPLIGQAHTRELAFTGKDIDAARAKEMGLVAELADDVAALHAAAERTAREIARNPPLTVRGVKQVLAFGEGKPVADGLAYVAAWNAAFLASEDLGEALSSFLEKRPPDYKGR